MDIINIKTATRVSKGLLASSIGFMCLLVSFDNIIDFNSNYQFVQHVLSMDTMKQYFQGGVLLERAIINPSFHLIAYWLIIIGEGLSGLLAFSGGLLMILGINDGQKFLKGRLLYILGGTIALMVWYFGFAVIGGEWFSMWANKWNGQSKAYTFATFILISMIYVQQQEKESE
jgi:predicted small integral membrane protein